ncbi:MAG TPA: YkgJ family cysteine cluster protein [Acidimicrobiales bacterium]|nr:YkgJ family cysteine cluster protein [Acidimicrobiales bacterium]
MVDSGAGAARAHQGELTDGELDAGDFTAWLDGVRAAMAGRRGSVVPCDGCTACCASYQFVHISPDETDTLARIPRRLLFPAPRLPRGHVLLGYDKQGRCPMLIDGRCSIYDHRPRTCRTYDCRVLAAAGVEPEEDEKEAIAARVRRWKFRYPTDADRVVHEAVRTAAAWLARHPDGAPPASATQLAVMAVDAHEAFLTADGKAVEADPDPQAVRVRLRHRKVRAELS